MISSEALGRIRQAYVHAKNDPAILALISAREEVYARYSELFSFKEVSHLEEATIRSFLYYENNKHWTGLNRQVNRICRDMSATQKALALLTDESQPLASRFDAAAAQVFGLGKGIMTAILHVSAPQLYGVWNGTAEAALVELGLWPSFPRGTTVGQKYEAVNRILLTIVDELRRDTSEFAEVDLWVLDAVWWGVSAELIDDDSTPTRLLPAEIAGSSSFKAFSIERHLHDYIFEAWDSIELGKDWSIYAIDGDPEAGYELVTPIGRIDLLAKHKREPRWLVIELKRSMSSDQVVGQVMRYMGYVKKHIAQPEELVEGIIIATGAEEKLCYALSACSNIRFLAYELQFSLKELVID